MLEEKNRDGRTGLSIRFLSAALLGVTALLPAARAAEGGLSNFPAGAQTTYAALMPPPGTTSFFGYALYISADSVRDDNGDRIPGVEVEVVALAPRLIHTWKPSFAGFNLSSGIVIEGVYAKVEVPGAEDETTGPTLLGIEPLYLTRSFGSLHVLTGPLLYFPLGPYDRNAPANSTTNYYSFAYQASTTWTPTPSWDLSLNAAVEFKDRNKDTDYRSGTQSSLTFGLGHRPFENQKWDLGVSGFYTRQLSDDKIDGDDVPGGARTRKFAIGPKLVYWLKPGAAIVAQWHREMETRNASEGDLFWLECAFPL
ncbi:MAG: SphA family protein [Panacagrimonas sp.]